MNAIECRDLTKAYRGSHPGSPHLFPPAGCILGWWGKAGGQVHHPETPHERHFPGRGAGLLAGGGQPEPRVSPDQAGHRGGAGRGLPAGGHHPRETGSSWPLTHTRWDQGLYEQYLARFAPAQGQEVQGALPGMKMKPAIAAALSPRGQTAAAGRGHQRPGPHGPGRGAGRVQRLHPLGRPHGGPVLPTSSATWRRSATTSPSSTGASWSSRGEGPAAGGVRIVKLDPQQLQELNPAAIAGVEAHGAPGPPPADPRPFVTSTNLEDIILFLAKGRVPEAPRTERRQFPCSAAQGFGGEPGKTSPPCGVAGLACLLPAWLPMEDAPPLVFGPDPAPPSSFS